MVPPEVLADYLLFKLNKLKNEEFVEVRQVAAWRASLWLRPYIHGTTTIDSTGVWTAGTNKRPLRGRLRSGRASSRRVVTPSIVWTQVLPAVAEKAVARREDGGLDLDGAARYMLKAFRKGWLGKMMLDEFPDGWQPPANLRSSRSRLAASRAQQQGGQAHGARKNGRQQGSSRDSRRGRGRRHGKSR